MTLTNGTPDEKIRWGILGTGFIAGLQTQDLQEHGFTVQAVGSRSLESARAFADQHGVAAAHGSYESLVADPAVDVVYIATRTRSTMRTPCSPSMPGSTCWWRRLSP